MRLGVLFLLIFATPGWAQQQNPDQLLDQAIAEQQRGDFQAAIRDYRKVLEIRPDMVEAKANLGAALAHAGELDEAIAIYNSVLPSLSDKTPVLLNLGLAYYKKGDFAHAQEQFAAVNKLEPSNSRVAILLADADVRLGHQAEAVALLEPLDAANAQNLDFQFVYGSALIGVGRLRDGVPRVEQVAAATQNASAYLLAGASRLQMNDYESARSDLEAALRLDPQLPNIYTLVGSARDKTGDSKSAEPALREALKRNPDDFEANLTLGAILYKRRELNEARTLLDHSLRLKPEDPVARYEFAMLKSAAGEYNDAAQLLETLVKDQPNWLDPHIELAALYYKLHRPQDGAKEREIVERLSAEQQSKKRQP